MEKQKIPTSVYAEVTPNPRTIKFVANRAIIPFTDAVEFKSAEDVKGNSKLAAQLFNFPFVEGLFFTTNFVSITKVEEIEWDLITMQLREFVQEFLSENEWAVDQLPVKPEAKGKTPAQQELLQSLGHVEPQTETEFKIVEALDDYIRPAVESDGGAIDFRSFKEGRLEVTLRGSCSGCPSSVVTLKNGIETLMQNMVPDVKEVVAYEA